MSTQRPAGPWAWRQSWRDLLFAHWPVSVDVLQRLVPEGLEVQEFDGTAWVGVIPFRMTGVMRRWLPNLPWVSAFPEINVRTYVERDGKPGVWFLSLDAGNRLAVGVARRLFHLPYHHARMTSKAGADGSVRYRSRRYDNPSGLTFRARYSPVGGEKSGVAGSLDAWLTERYSLYAQAPSGALWRTDIHHVPWPLQPAEAEIERNDYLEPHGLVVEGAPVLHFSRRVDVKVWSPVLV